MELLELPAELIAHILSYLPPHDIAQFGQSCRHTRSFIAPENQLLWQSAFLHVFDDPQDAWSQLTPTARKVNQSVESNWDWHARLKQRLLGLRVVNPLWAWGVTGALDNDISYRENTIAAILDVIETAKPTPSKEELKRGREPTIDDRSSLNICLLPNPHEFTYGFDKTLRGSSENPAPPCADSDASSKWHSPGRPTTRAMARVAPSTRSEAASKLHVLGGLTEQDNKDDRAFGAARRLVYDWHKTNVMNDYGPFKPDGQVDWTRLEAVCNIAIRHFSRSINRTVYGDMAVPHGFNYSIPFRTLVDPSLPHDWARVTGTWCGTYVFLNFEDLLEFNTIADPTLRPTLEDGPESCGGMMKLELKLNKELQNDPKLQSALPVCNDYPPLFFSGLSSTYDFHMSTGVRGMACLAPNGKEVRWRFIVNYSGADQWQLEGVQPGGVRSGCIYGLWTSCLHEEGGPVGPFIYAPEELCESAATVSSPQKPESRYWSSFRALINSIPT